jgi:hypothetical protein
MHRYDKAVRNLAIYELCPCARNFQVIIPIVFVSDASRGVFFEIYKRLGFYNVDVVVVRVVVVIVEGEKERLLEELMQDANISNSTGGDILAPMFIKLGCFIIFTF